MSRLSSLVRETNDPEILQYIVDNLGKDIPMGSPYRQRVMGNIPVVAMKKLMWLQWMPPPKRNPLLERHLAFLKKQIEDAKKQREFLQAMLDEAVREDVGFIVQKLRDEQPLNRWLALQVVQRKWYPAEHLVLDLLDDPAPLVRQTARETLTRLSRGQDFGPLPGANRKQVQEAQAAWRTWLDAELAMRAAR